MTCLALLTRDGLSEPTTAQQVLDIAIARKAFVADAERVFWRKWRAIDDQAFAAAGAALVTARNRLGTRLAASKYDGIATLEEEVEARQQILATNSFYRHLQESDPAQRQKLERFLRGLLDTGSPWSAAKQADVAAEPMPNRNDVARQLREDTVLIEFVRVETYDPIADSFPGDARYWALVLLRGGDVSGVDLGEAAQIEAALKAGLAALRRPDPLDATPQIKAMKHLYRLVWAPLALAVGEAKRVVLSPDGALGLCPFAALVNEAGQSVVERHDLQQVLSARDLLPSPEKIVVPSAPVIIANPEPGDASCVHPHSE